MDDLERVIEEVFFFLKFGIHGYNLISYFQARIDY